MNTNTRDAHTHTHAHAHAHAHPAHHTPVHIHVEETVVSVAPAAAAGSSAQSAAKFQEELKTEFKQLEAQFVKHFGADAVEKLRAACTLRPVVTIGGDQLTGKSTLSNMVAEALKGAATSAGSVFRAIAKERNLTVAQLSKLARDEPEIDVRIDYELCRMICQGQEHGTLVIEGRQPALMATYVKHRFGKENIVRLYLSCEIRHQALRFIRREIGLDAYEQAQKQIPLDNYQTLADVAVHVKAMDIEKVDVVASMFQDNQNRDADDQQRYVSLYGFGDHMNYRNSNLYDVIIDTTHRDINGVFQAAMEELKQRKFADGSKL